MTESVFAGENPRKFQVYCSIALFSVHFRLLGGENRVWGCLVQIWGQAIFLLLGGKMRYSGGSLCHRPAFDNFEITTKGLEN